jgi:uncharacterized damage-inducible protein DinB
MNIQNISTIIDRDLKRLKTEVELYKNESNLWITNAEIVNSAGNLCLHLIGNLNTYVGLTLGKIEYVRNRELEFSSKNIPRTELISKIEATQKVVKISLQDFSIADLEKEFPVTVFDQPTSTEYLLIHLTTHLTYHLGQINYHRRLLDK